MKRYMNFNNNYDNNEIFTQQEYRQKKKELVEKYLTVENLKRIPTLYNMLVEEYRFEFTKKMEYKIEYLYKNYQERYKFYGVLEKDDSAFLYLDLLHIIFNNMVMDLDLEIILENEKYVHMVFNEFGLKNEL